MVTITVKTLKNDEFKVDVEPSATVAETKVKIAAAKNFAVEGMKLICSGKILSDTVTVESCNLSATDFFVVMAKPAKAAAPSTAAPAVAPAEAPAVAPAAAPADATLQPSTEADPTPVAAAAPSHGSEEQITQIMEMGFPREQAIAALKSAFGNGERAVEYLMHGGPSSMETEDAATATPAAGAGAGATAAAPAGDLGTLSESSPLAELLDNPMFAQLRAFVQRQPHQLPALLQQLGRQQPDLVQLINANRNDFYLLLNTPVSESEGPGPGHAAGGQQQVQVTPAENEAIERLCAMGFDKGLVVQAYFACDKNEELAANYLISNLD